MAAALKSGEKRMFVGTSGWNYKHWRNGVFYPPRLASSHWLEFYARHFNSVELNVTFYRLVPRETFQSWYRHTPADFYFVAKGSRYITHIKRLHDAVEPLDIFLKNARPLKEKLLAVLWQLPPGFKKDLIRLEHFLALLSRKSHGRQAFEFRHDSWFDEDVYSLLKKFNACLCVAHSSKFPCQRMTTADFAYLRFHGSTLYSGNYSAKELAQWAAYARSLKVRDVLAYFNNDAGGFAVKNAALFSECLKNPSLLL